MDDQEDTTNVYLHCNWNETAGTQISYIIALTLNVTGCSSFEKETYMILQMFFFATLLISQYHIYIINDSIQCAMVHILFIATQTDVYICTKNIQKTLNSTKLGPLYIRFLRHLYLFIERVVSINSMTLQNYFLLNLLSIYIFVHSIFFLILFLDGPFLAIVSVLHTKIYIPLLKLI